MSQKFERLEALIDSILADDEQASMSLGELINILAQPHTCSRFLAHGC